MSGPLHGINVVELVGTQSREHWEKVFEGTDACVTPVLSLSESLSHPHLVARRTFLEIGDVAQPAPAPRFSLTELDPPRIAAQPGADTDQVLAELGYNEGEIGMLRRAGAVSGTSRED